MDNECFVKTPWTYLGEKRKLEEQLREKEEELEEASEEVEKFRKRFEAEKERRSELSRKKQEAEKELKKARQRLEQEGESQKSSEEKKDRSSRRLSFRQAFKGLKKLSSISSDDEDLVTVYGDEDQMDLKALKNSISREEFRHLENGHIVFSDGDFLRLKLETRPFFKNSWSTGESFETEPLRDFIDKEKVWILASMGSTEIFREASGEFELIDSVKSRVDRKQKKGGFSQGRFERKRDEQIQNHADAVNKKLEEVDGEKFVLGDKRLCEDLNAEYLGGFDSSREASPNVFYNFRVKFF